MSDTTGGTVTYHRAEYHPDSAHPWSVWFTEDAKTSCIFTAEQGEAMGLTPPEPAPLTPLDVISTIGVTFGNSRPVDYLLDRDDAEMVLDALAEAGYEVVLRDARQDPQPASDERCVRCHGEGGWTNHGQGFWEDCPNCTPDPQPEQGDTASDTIDFDALPIGTVLRDKDWMLWLRTATGWTNGADPASTLVVPWPQFAPYTVVYQPAPLSPGECLRGLLAGRDDADELIEKAYRGHMPRELWLAVGDAAREVH